MSPTQRPAGTQEKGIVATNSQGFDLTNDLMRYKHIPQVFRTRLEKLYNPKIPPTQRAKHAKQLLRYIPKPSKEELQTLAIPELALALLAFYNSEHQLRINTKQYLELAYWAEQCMREKSVEEIKLIKTAREQVTPDYGYFGFDSWHARHAIKWPNRVRSFASSVLKVLKAVGKPTYKAAAAAAKEILTPVKMVAEALMALVGIGSIIYRIKHFYQDNNNSWAGLSFTAIAGLAFGDRRGINIINSLQKLVITGLMGASFIVAATFPIATVVTTFIGFGVHLLHTGLNARRIKKEVAGSLAILDEQRQIVADLKAKLDFEILEAGHDNSKMTAATLTKRVRAEIADYQMRQPEDEDDVEAIQMVTQEKAGILDRQTKTASTLRQEIAALKREFVEVKAQDQERIAALIAFKEATLDDLIQRALKRYQNTPGSRDEDIEAYLRETKVLSVLEKNHHTLCTKRASSKSLLSLRSQVIYLGGIIGLVVAFAFNPLAGAAICCAFAGIKFISKAQEHIKRVLKNREQKENLCTPYMEKQTAFFGYISEQSLDTATMSNNNSCSRPTSAQVAKKSQSFKQINQGLRSETATPAKQPPVTKACRYGYVCEESLAHALSRTFKQLLAEQTAEKRNCEQEVPRNDDGNVAVITPPIV